MSPEADVSTRVSRAGAVLATGPTPALVASVTRSGLPPLPVLADQPPACRCGSRPGPTVGRGDRGRGRGSPGGRDPDGRRVGLSRARGAGEPSAGPAGKACPWRCCNARATATGSAVPGASASLAPTSCATWTAALVWTPAHGGLPDPGFTSTSPSAFEAPAPSTPRRGTTRRAARLCRGPAHHPFTTLADSTFLCSLTHVHCRSV